MERFHETESEKPLASLSNKDLILPSPRSSGAATAAGTLVQLRAELGKRKLPTEGLKAVLEERPLEAAKTEEAKRTKSAINGIADEYIAPITHRAADRTG